MALAAAIMLTSCGKKQAETEQDVPLKVTYTIDCSRDLLSLCDLVVTYKGDDGVNVTDTITGTPGDTTEVQTWTKVVATHKVPVKIGYDYNLVPKGDTLTIDRPTASLHAIGTIIAEKMGIRKREPIPLPSEKVINGKYFFFKDNIMMDQKVRNTRNNLANIIKNLNDSLATNREATKSNTCFLIKPHPYGKGLLIMPSCMNDDK